MSGTLKNIVPVTLNVEGRNICLVSDMKSELAYASFLLRGGYYTESDIQHVGITHLIEHIIFESWAKCYKDKHKHDSKHNSLHTLIKLSHRSKRHNHNIRTSSKKNSQGNQPKPGTPKSCLQFWNNRPVMYNGHTRVQSVDVFMYGLASDAPLIVDYITQMICNCPKHLNLKMLDHIKNTVLTELIASQSNSTNKLQNELIYKQTGSKLHDAIGSRHYMNITRQIENLKKLTPQDINDYYYRYFTIENAVFFYGGCISEAQVRKSISLHNAHSKRFPPSTHSSSHANHVVFDPKKLFSDEFIVCSPNKKEKYPTTVIKDPSVKNNAVFTLMFPMEQSLDGNYINTRSVLYQLQLSIFSMVTSSELLELLRHHYNLVYGIYARCVIYSGINVFKISGTCSPSHVKQVIEICKLYLNQRKHKPVPNETVKSEKGKFKLSSFIESVSLSNVMTYYEGIVYTSMVSNGSKTIHDIINDSKFESYHDCINYVDRVSPLDIMNHFKRICMSNMVAGYVVK